MKYVAKIFLSSKIISNIVNSFETDCEYFKNNEIKKIWYDFAIIDMSLLHVPWLLDYLSEVLILNIL